MLTSGSQNLVLSAALLSLLSLLQPPTAAGQAICGSVDRFAVALQFAEVIFPELKGKELSVSLSHGNGGFVESASQIDDLQLRFDKPTWHPPGETNEKSDAILTEAMEKTGIGLPFYVYFSFIEMNPPIMPRRLACYPLKFTSDAGHEQMRKAQEAIEPHPEWSDAQEVEEARKLGLRYGPGSKDAVLRLIPLKELSQFYGPLTVKSAQFFMNGGQKCAGCSFVLPLWEVKVLAAHDARWLSITVEPFFGRITNLSSGE
jgi:hypothetical protein